MLNQVVLQGRLTADPEIRIFDSGRKVLNFVLAVPKGPNEEGAYFINITAWNNQAEYICKHYRKGNAMLLTGRIETSSWKNDEGKTQNKTYVRVWQTYFNRDPKEISGAGFDGGNQGNGYGYSSGVAVEGEAEFEELDDGYDEEGLPF